MCLPVGPLAEKGQNRKSIGGKMLKVFSFITFQDDPLSALDAHVGRHVMEEAIIKRMVKRRKTVIFVTHHVQYLPHASQVFTELLPMTVTF